MPGPMAWLRYCPLLFDNLSEIPRSFQILQGCGLGVGEVLKEWQMRIFFHHYNKIGLYFGGGEGYSSVWSSALPNYFQERYQAGGYNITGDCCEHSRMSK